MASVGSNASGAGASTKGGTATDIDAQIKASKDRRGSAERTALIADAKASAQRASGNAANAQGQAQSMQGAVSMGMGGVQVITGGILIQQAAANAVWTCGSSSSIMVAGITMMIAGLGQIATGTMQMSMGNQKIAEGTSQLAKAAQEGIISKEQASIANKEMIRSQIFESKKDMLEGTMDMLAKEGKLKGADGENLTQEQLEKLQTQGAGMFDKAFQAGADALKNGGEMGIMTLKTEGAADRYFVKDDDGIMEVDLLKNEDGTNKLDDNGRIQIDTDNVLSGRTALTDDQELELVFNFAVMDQMKDMITGHKGDPNANPPTADVPPLARIEVDPVTGEVKKGDFNLKNPLHMKEFAALVEAAGKNPPPLKFIEDKETKELYFQKWDWDKNEATGEKVSIKDMTGGVIDKSQADWKTKAKETAKAAFEKAGLGEDSDIYKLLKPLAAESESNDKKKVSLDEYKDYWANLTKPSTLGQRSSTSNSFYNNSNRLALS